MRYAIFIAGVFALCLGIAIERQQYIQNVPASTYTPLVDGLFTSTYLPAGWEVTEDKITTYVKSPDLAFEPPAVPEDCTGTAPDGLASEGCAINATQPVLARGAYFQLAYDPCLYGMTETEFRAHEQQNYASSTSLVSQEPITIAGRTAVLFHTQSPTNTPHPGKDDYFLTVPVSGADCQDVNFGFVESSTTDYYAEYQRLLNGLQFVPGKTFHP